MKSEISVAMGFHGSIEEEVSALRQDPHARRDARRPHHTMDECGTTTADNCQMLCRACNFGKD